ncbi:MAG: tRNA uridine-5-carboxymethylaminomethyl(34) synthesis GTPase MnmE [Caldimicrobium sp.]|nr:tRNA uridine-5-carboxymethylaminomethyl(34) synthesis GTPase MnmE [Caldimicrobium sp.]MCX7613718.1 tRNA uridine-5-carboxymethylaminomethyl(34) synthesis GTPase MnmE [Caldimicrobium sp.]MDW8183183.1 tRNA uridine-5-carboxymethylaminomethyl(34) synthesis GTPase MnmE [Caldimicrobium sp.]
MKPKFYPEDTIAAIATPPGRGAIGVIKISGDQALSILEKIFQPKKPKPFLESHRFHYGYIKDRESNEFIDEVLVVYMKKPYSYTREDVVEIHAHSGFFNLKRVLELVLKEGARAAEPGEFTFRAFINGRIDLAQAEAIEEIVSAKSEISLNLAIKNLSGKLSEKINLLRENLLSILAQVEAAIDFPEEDIEIMNPPELKRLLEENIDELNRLIENYREGKIYREGISLVISGKPNVGKSSLMNILLKEERAIVTPIPGTTRDFLEEEVYIKGLPVKLIDTAGLRETEDLVEKMGVERAIEKLKEADLVLLLVDAGSKPTKEDTHIYNIIKPYNHLIVINKVDLSMNFLEDWREFLKSLNEEFVEISVKEHQGIDLLTQRIFDKITHNGIPQVLEVVPNLRQKIALEKAKGHLLLALEELKKEEPLAEILAMELREAFSDLAEILGEVSTEDVLSDIFSRFCIGK